MCDFEKYGDCHDVHLRCAQCPARMAPAAAPRPARRDAAQALELAYGLIWHVPVDKATEAGRCVSLARLALLEQLDRAGQSRGIDAARDVILRARESRTNPRTVLVSKSNDLIYRR